MPSINEGRITMELSDVLSITLLSTPSTPEKTGLIWSFFISQKDSITFLIALFGFVLSMYNFIRTLIQDHIHLRISYKNHLCIPTSSKGSMILAMDIENLSRLPISISRMFLNIGDDIFEFSYMPHFVYERTERCGDEIVDKITTYTIQFPISISALGIDGGFFHIVGNITEQRLAKEKTSITIWTNRGKRTYEIVMNNEVHHPN